MYSICRYLKTWIIVLLIIVLNGCAELTVNVDVYKGPLANNDDVLTQQTTIMAVGAKPLLIQLRNKLEENEIQNIAENRSENILNEYCRSDQLKAFRKLSHYRSDYISKERYAFCSDQAMQINSILTLYEDRTSEDGGLEMGLGNLIEQFLKTRKETSSLEEIEKVRRRLFNALARFAQKILFVSNNVSLFLTDEENEKDISNYIQVLQTVGNSITIQVDQLSKQRGFGVVLQEKRTEELAVPVKSAPNRTNDALDQLILLMKYEYHNEVRKSSKDSTTAKDLKSVLGVAYEQRSDNARLRPALAYLRTSFPDTSLQDDAATVWENLLAKFGMRGIPLSKFEGKDAKTQLEIDKQFWQNINRIQLSAAGNTNYVLMKDDIGNWTVKNMSADPKDIIKSAKNLALFGAGGALGANMTDAIRGPGGPGTELAKPEPLVKRQFNKFENRYRKQAQADLKGLVKEISGEDGINSLEHLINKSWEKAFKDDAALHAHLKSELGEAAKLKEYNEDAKKSPPLLNADPKPNPSKGFIDRLKAVENFYKRAKKRIQDSNDRSIEGKKEAAIASMSQTVHDFIAKHNAKRMGHVAQFNTQVTVLSESIAPEEAPKK
jgi:hypothetical protein